MTRTAEVYESVCIEDVRQAVAEAGHSVDIRDNPSGRRTLHCETDGMTYAVQFYPNEGHETDSFGALRFALWMSADNISAETANAFNAKYRFASAFADDDCYVLQHDIIAIGASKQNLVICVQQWSTSIDDFVQFLDE